MARPATVVAETIARDVEILVMIKPTKAACSMRKLDLKIVKQAERARESSGN